VLERPPNLSGGWLGAPGTLQFNFVHRFGVGPAPLRKVTNSPTFLLSYQLPLPLLIGFNYATSSDVGGANYPNEWETFGRYARSGVALQAGYNQAAASVDAELKEAVPTMQIVHYDTYALCFDAVRDKQVSGFLADEVLLWAYAQKSSAPSDYMMIPDYDLPRTAGFAIKKDEPRFTKFVDDVLLDLEKSGEAEKIFNAWFAPVKRPFKITAD